LKERGHARESGGVPRRREERGGEGESLKSNLRFKRDDATLVSPLPSSKMNADAAQRYASRATALREVGLDGCRRSALASLRARTVVKVRDLRASDANKASVRKTQRTHRRKGTRHAPPDTRNGKPTSLSRECVGV
jgi:hypothetical protein